MEEDPELDEIIEKSGNSEALIDAARKIKSVFCNIEKKIVDGENPNIVEGAHLGEVYSAIVEEPSAYVVPLIKWSLKRLAKTINNALKQRTLSEFYENMPKKGYFVYKILGVPKKPNLKIFTKEADEFYIQTLKLDKLKMGRYDKIPFTVAGVSAKIMKGERKKWDADYKDLAKRIQEEGQNYSVMLMHSNIKISDFDNMQTMSVFLDEFSRYHAEKNITR